MFYTLSQNNSGGDWIENDEVRQEVIVEADSYDEARDKLREITEDHSEYCDCCGERWWFYSIDENETPCVNGKSLYDEKHKEYYSGHYIIYYKDGRKEFQDK